MGLALLLLITGLYIFVLIKAFFVNKPSGVVSIAYFETLKLNAKIILIISLFLLAIVLIIHGGVYWGFTLFSSIFAILGFITPTSMDDKIEVYAEQVAFIIFFILLPYAKYSLSIVKKFKIKLFDFLLEKYDSNIEVTKEKVFGSINDIVFANQEFLYRVKNELLDTKIKNSSSSHIDDTFYFPDKKMYITEVTIETMRHIYRIDSKGKGKWKVESYETAFNGLVIVLPKAEYNPSSTIQEPTLFSVNNNSASISSEPNRSNKKHGFILDFYYQHFRDAKRLIYDTSNFSDETFNHFNTTLEDYSTQNTQLTSIAQRMNINYIMEERDFIYLFHNEKNIDLFTFYQNEDVSVSLETFENDFKLLLKISEEFNTLQ